MRKNQVTLTKFILLFTTMLYATTQAGALRERFKEHLQQKLKERLHEEGIRKENNNELSELYDGDGDTTCGKWVLHIAIFKYPSFQLF